MGTTFVQGAHLGSSGHLLNPDGIDGIYMRHFNCTISPAPSAPRYDLFDPVRVSPIVQGRVRF